jgi:hypothetical protein
MGGSVSAFRWTMRGSDFRCHLDAPVLRRWRRAAPRPFLAVGGERLYIVAVALAGDVAHDAGHMSATAAVLQTQCRADELEAKKAVGPPHRPR